MKHRKNELDVDYIGGHKPLTNEEADAISEYLKSKKTRKTLQKTRTSSSRRKKITS